MATIWDEMQRLQTEMDTLFNRFFGAGTPMTRTLLAGPSNAVTDYRQPLADVIETDKEIIATIELPGVEKGDIEVTASDGGVNVRVEKRAEERKEEEGMRRIERSYRGFYRRIPLPDYADTGRIDATYRNGVLELRVPLREEARKSRRIQVK